MNIIGVVEPRVMLRISRRSYVELYPSIFSLRIYTIVTSGIHSQLCQRTFHKHGILPHYRYRPYQYSSLFPNIRFLDPRNGDTLSLVST